MHQDLYAASSVLTLDEFLALEPCASVDERDQVRCVHHTLAGLGDLNQLVGLSIPAAQEPATTEWLANWQDEKQMAAEAEFRHDRDPGCYCAACDHMIDLQEELDFMPDWEDADLERLDAKSKLLLEARP